MSNPRTTKTPRMTKTTVGTVVSFASPSGNLTLDCDLADIPGYSADLGPTIRDALAFAVGESVGNAAAMSTGATWSDKFAAMTRRWAAIRGGAWGGDRAGGIAAEIIGRLRPAWSQAKCAQVWRDMSKEKRDELAATSDFRRVRAEIMSERTTDDNGAAADLLAELDD